MSQWSNFLMKKFIVLLLMFSSFEAYAISPLWIGFGTMMRNYKSAQKKPNGDTQGLAFNPTILVGTTLPFFYADFFFSPGIGYAKYSSEDNTSRSEILLQYHISQRITSSFLLQYGFSNTITKIGGKGGTVVLNNGSGTATFYTPSETKSSYIASLDLGAELIFSSSLGTRLQFSIDRFLSSKRRRVSPMLTANYYF